MDTGILSCIASIITQALVVIKWILDAKVTYHKDDLNKQEDETARKILAQLIENDLIVIQPPKAKQLVKNLLLGNIDTQTAIKQANEIKENNNEKTINKINN